MDPATEKVNQRMRFFGHFFQAAVSADPVRPVWKPSFLQDRRRCTRGNSPKQELLRFVLEIHHTGRVIAKRVIPCLDVHGGQVTRGVQFGRAEEGGLRNVGDPVELALRYNEQGADEMVFFDITASAHDRATMVDVIGRAADQCFMPLTVGGGLRTVDDMFTMLRAGADKVSINSSAIANPDLIRQGSEKFGSQCIVVSIDSKRVAPDRSEVFSHGGRKATGKDTMEWVQQAVSLGAGEIVLNSIDADGTRQGFDIEITRQVSESVGVPVVASGGAGNLDHMANVLIDGKADAVLAASIFHFGEFTVEDVKRHLATRGINVRLQVTRSR